MPAQSVLKDFGNIDGIGDFWLVGTLMAACRFNRSYKLLIGNFRLPMRGAERGVAKGRGIALSLEQAVYF